MARRAMQQKERRLWSERFLGYQAKWFIFPIVGLFTFMQLIAHDGGVYGAIDKGADASTLNQLYFPNWSFADGVQLIQMTIAVIVILIGFAIFIRYAKWHYANHGIALD